MNLPTTAFRSWTLRRGIYLFHRIHKLCGLADKESPIDFKTAFVLVWWLIRLISILGDPGVVSGGGRKGVTKVFKHRRKSPWVPTLTGPFLNGQANAGSWLGAKNSLYYCVQSANSISWVLFVGSYMTAIDSLTACLAHAPNKCAQSGIFQSRGGHLGIFWVDMCLPGLQFGTPF